VVSKSKRESQTRRLRWPSRVGGVWRWDELDPAEQKDIRRYAPQQDRGRNYERTHKRLRAADKVASHHRRQHTRNISYAIYNRTHTTDEARNSSIPAAR